MSVDFNNNSLYAEFKDARPSWTLIGCALSLGIIGVFGMTFNFCVIFVTIRSKALNGTANYLLALCSFFELLHQHGHFLFMFTAISGQNFIEYRTAATITSLSVFGLGGIAISMFFTGIDRLFCVVAAEMHSKVDKRLYLGAITIICAIFCAMLIYTLFLTAQLLAGVMITGCIVDIVQGPSVNFFAPTTLYINLVTSAVYAIVGIVVKMKTSSIAQSATNRRILRSLFAIIALNMGGYLLNTGYVVFLRPAVTWPVTAWFWQVITAIPLNISAASNGPILYFTSSEYRREFYSAFPRVFQKASKPTQQMLLKTITLKRKVADMPKN
uniref:G_PROTEIN_RECEP_F1_2 domain-containing protein n=1 Tax=Globodera pallida TaxID=36090 RepID=A0A183BSJ3_GLOPA